MSFSVSVNGRALSLCRLKHLCHFGDIRQLKLLTVLPSLCSNVHGTYAYCIHVLPIYYNW